MFSVLDTAAETVTRPKTLADRACDQCKLRKIRCDMKRPCLVCSSKGFNCTYERARKKRGPMGKRVKQIIEQQNKTVGDNSTTRSQGGKGDGPRDLGTNHDTAIDLQVRTPTSSYSTSDADVAAFSTQTPCWHTGVLGPSSDLNNSPMQDVMMPSLQQVPPSGTTLSETSQPYLDTILSSPNASDFVFPSLPLDSPSTSWDPFGAMLQQDLPSLTTRSDIWPSHINEETLLPWIDVYFKRLHPTVPILNRTALYREMLLRKQHTDQQFGAMLLALCAFAMTQPVQIDERHFAPPRAAQARMLMEECVRLRVAADFGENPCIEMVLTSFFLFACLFGSSQYKAARLRLREAVDLAQSLGVHLPQSYNGLGTEVRGQWLRTYLVLSVTERAYALQQRHSIDFRGRPGITARFMQAFDPTDATAFISNLILHDQSDSVGLTGLLYLMAAFDSFEATVIECWIGCCSYSDGTCDSFDSRRALQIFKLQYNARQASMDGNVSLVPSAAPLPLSQLLETQQADISITQLWLLNRLWNLCLSHGLVRESSDHPELEYAFACRIARAVLETCRGLSLTAMEVHGVGFVEKIYDVAMDVIAAIKSSVSITPGTKVLQLHVESFNSRADNDVVPTVQTLLQGLDGLLRYFRGGDHAYTKPFAAALGRVSPGVG